MSSILATSTSYSHGFNVTNGIHETKIQALIIPDSQTITAAVTLTLNMKTTKQYELYKPLNHAQS